jgi:hypothetical protein
MGLDMYLKKTKRVKGLKTEDYSKVNKALGKHKKTPKTLANENIEGYKPEMDELLSVTYKPYTIFDCIGIFKEVGYWRKANQIHNWFVKSCQGGVDECQLTEVNEGKLKKLLGICENLLAEKTEQNAKKTLAPKQGFFFGSYEINEWYWGDIEETIKILKEVLANTDFKEEIVFYRSSW